MPDEAYRNLLDATLRHLESLRDQGIRHVPVRAETLALLKDKAPVRPAQAQAQAQPARPAQVAPPAQTLAPARAPQADRAPARPPAAPRPLRPVARPTLPSRTPHDPAWKRSALDALRARASDCIQCAHLASSRKSVVFGVGNIDADIVFVGEAPGADEDAQGEPFVGKAGELLTKIIHAMDLSRDRVYIANVLKCRPDTPGQSSGNRKPTPAEMAICLPYLREQIEIIQPKVIVALGATAIEGLLGQEQVFVTRIRGQWLQFQDWPVMPTFHPAYLVRNDTPTEKRKLWEDMLAVMELIGLPISARQRGFFTKPA